MKDNSGIDFLSKYIPIEQALQAAKKKHPIWPENIHKRMSIVIEEIGEVSKAILQYEDEGGDWDEIKKEMEQSAAMCVRFLESLEKYKYDRT